MIESIIWLLVLELIGLLALPIAFTFFSFLPERGYALSKTLGLLLSAFVVWFVGMLGVPFTALTSWVITVGLLGGLSGWLLWRNKRSLLWEMGEWFGRHRWLVLVMELVFIAAYYYVVNLRSYMPEIRDQEKFGDFAFLNSMALSSKLPPTDPWMSGYTINYYYFSHFMMAMLTKMSGILPAIAFNFTVPLVAGLVALSAFGLVYNLVAVARGKIGGWAGGLSGLIASLFVCFVGNLDAFRQLIAPRIDKNEVGLGAPNFSFSWWNPSRVIWDYMPDGAGNYVWNQTINEFPFFSFLLADMHPHVMALPFVLLVIAAAFNLLRAPAEGSALSLKSVTGILNFGILAIACGALYFLNTWDYPTFLILVLGAALVREFWRGSSEVAAPEEKHEVEQPGKLSLYLKLLVLGGNIPARLNRGWGQIWRFVGFSGRLGVVSLLLYLPFHLTFTSLLGEKTLPDPINKIPILSTIGKIFGAVAWDRTPLLGYVLVFGVFILPMLSFLALKLWPYLQDPYSYLPPSSEDDDETPPVKFAPTFTTLTVFGVGVGMLLLSELLFFSKISLEFSMALGLVTAPVLAAGVGMLAYDFLASIRRFRSALELKVFLGVCALALIALGWVMHFELYGPLIITVVIAGLLLWFETKKPVGEASLADMFGLLLILLPAIINWFTEIIYLRDLFESRFNTIFKFYYQTWLMFALAAAYSCWRVIAYLWQLRPYEQDYSEVQADEALWAEKRKLQQPVPQRAGAFTQLQAAGAGNIAFSMGAGSSDTLYNWNPDEMEEIAAAEEKKHPGWRWFWLFGVIVVVLLGFIYPLLAPYEKTGRFAERKGLDGEAWVRQTNPADYAAIVWLRDQAKADPNFPGIILEADSGFNDWINFSRVATFSGYPTVLGWYFHEAQWRGGNKEAMADLVQRPKDIDNIYNTTDISLAKSLLKEYNVKYVFVGGYETNTVSASLYSQVFRGYKPEGLAKFSQFMQPVYQQNGVTIYKFVG